MIRAFIGIRIDPSVARTISEARTELKAKLSGIRWVGLENLHFTLKFLGPIEETKEKPIAEALEKAVRPFPRFAILARGMGVFPDIRRARVLWVGLEGEKLVPLVAAVEGALEPVGFAREKREFRPHLTIGRWRSFNGRPEVLQQEIERWKEYDFGASKVEEAVFFQSVLRPEGAIYTPLRVIPLKES